MYAKIFLKKNREEALKRFHRWIFSGAIQRIEGNSADGDIVEVFSNDGTYLATGHYQKGSITVRIISFKQTTIDESFWEEKLQKSIAMRLSLGFFDHAETNVFRLVHGEGDGFPGLIVDYYNGVVVLQAHSVGMFRERETFARILQRLNILKTTAVFDKSSNTINYKEGEAKDIFLSGNEKLPQVSEYGNQFLIDIETGQKTGFFIDQRENRHLLQQYSHGRTVLNLFGYTGGFSVYAIRGGAKMTDTVDVSESAIQLTNKNIELNFGTNAPHQSFVVDAFEYLKNPARKYDLIILDPPAFAKHQSAIDNAMKAYRRLNRQALEQILPQGILFTFSCSQVVNSEMFQTAVLSAAIDAGRSVRILHKLTQPADHPINIFHPEGSYLKGLVLFVE
ncbi:MAG: class I SAM-dependent rRNA methyltransferase [Bacteroidales bacterium]|nr:class I SAM-dependent rRNA methyltransferase [Bacteroidales bacterium]